MGYAQDLGSFVTHVDWSTDSSSVKVGPARIAPPSSPPPYALYSRVYLVPLQVETGRYEVKFFAVPSGKPLKPEQMTKVRVARLLCSVVALGVTPTAGACCRPPVSSSTFLPFLTCSHSLPSLCAYPHLPFPPHLPQPCPCQELLVPVELCPRPGSGRRLAQGGRKGGSQAGRRQPRSATTGGRLSPTLLFLLSSHPGGRQLHCAGQQRPLDGHWRRLWLCQAIHVSGAREIREALPATALPFCPPAWPRPGCSTRPVSAGKMSLLGKVQALRGTLCACDPGGVHRQRLARHQHRGQRQLVRGWCQLLSGTCFTFVGQRPQSLPVSPSSSRPHFSRVSLLSPAPPTASSCGRPRRE